MGNPANRLEPPSDRDEAARSLEGVTSDSAGPTRLRVLLLEDSAFDADLTIAILQQAGFACEVERVDSRSAFEASLDRGQFDIVLADHNLPSFDGFTALQLFRSRQLAVPFVFVSGTLGEERAIESLRAGATDYVLKTHLARLGPVVTRALRECAEHRLLRLAEQAREEEAEITAALARVGQALIASLDRPELVKRICELSTNILKCDFSYALLRDLDADDQAFVAAQSFGCPSEVWETLQTLRLPPQIMIPVLDALAQCEVAVVRDGASDCPPLALGEAQTLRNGLYIPLRRGGEVLGVLAVGRRSTEAFSAIDLRKAAGLAHLASLALANARAVEELARVSQLKSDFVATMSHELRTPLNVIIGYNDLLGDEEFGALSTEQHEVVHRIGNSARQLLDLVNATLDMGRLETGRLSLAITQVVLSDLINELVSDLQPYLDSKPTVRVRYHLSPALPQLRTDPAKLKIVMKNVIENAVKFTESGEVHVTASPHANGIEVMIRDPGIGIEPAVMPIVFEPFRQGETAMTRRFGGVGLGLYIVRRLLEVLGGRITLESSPGSGTTARVWVPREIQSA